MICSRCGKDAFRTYPFEGGLLCRECILDIQNEPRTVERYLPGFAQRYGKEMGAWLLDPKNIGRYVPENMRDVLHRMLVEMLKVLVPWTYRNALEDFRTSRPGEWEDYLENLEGRE